MLVLARARRDIIKSGRIRARKLVQDWIDISQTRSGFKAASDQGLVDKCEDCSNVGAPADVPPTTLKAWLLSRKPLVQLDTFVPLGPSSDKIDMDREMVKHSEDVGTSRIPVPACQAGFAK